MRQRGMAESALLVCSFLAACGGGDPAGPGPQPSSSPSPAFPAGFVHVLASGQVTNYRIDRPTGRLDPVSSQEFGQSPVMSGEPRGRYVYLGNLAQSPRGTITTLAPNVTNGALSIRSEVQIFPYATTGGWNYLIAGPDRILGLWSWPWGHHVYSTLISQPVDANGVVSEKVRETDVYDGCARATVADWRGNLFYSECDGMVTSYSLEPDFALKPVSELRVCGPSAAPFRAWLTPLVGARGVFLADAAADQQHTVCTYEGLGLDPRADLGIAAPGRAAIAFDPADTSMPAQIAMSVARNERGETVSELRLYSVGPGAQLRLQDSRSPGSWPVAFHPVGRLLFAERWESDAQNPYNYRYQLVVYAFEPEGRLTEIQRIDQPGRPQVAVTFPASN